MKDQGNTATRAGTDAPYGSWRSGKVGLIAVAGKVTRPYGITLASWPARWLKRSLGFALAVTLVSLCLVPVAPAAEAQCPNEAIRAESNINPATGKPYSTELPDCRAYELVTSEKDDNTPLPPASADESAFVSPGGDALLWDRIGVQPYGQPSNGKGDALRAERASTGWSLPQTLAPEGIGGSYELIARASSNDMTSTVIEAQVNELSEVNGFAHQGPRSLMECSDPGVCTPIVEGISGAAEPISEIRVSPDGSRVVFQTFARLLPKDRHGPVSAATEQPLTQQVYEWTPASGLRLEGVNNEGVATSPCGAALADGYGGLVSHDVSANGSRVFFQSPDINTVALGQVPGECKLGPNGLYVSDLYLREDGSRSVDISKPPAGVPDYGARFVGASEDGSHVFFVSESELTPDQTTSGPGHANLFEYDVETGLLKRLSVGPPGYDDADVDAINGSLDEAAIVSADGSHVYFTALGQLVPGQGRTNRENSESCAGGPSSCTTNLYLYTGGRVSFIATIGPSQIAGSNNAFERNDLAPSLASFLAAVTPNGMDLVFGSERSLTAYDSEGHDEIYRYDAPTSTISCVSCSPTSTHAEGVTSFHASLPFLAGDTEGTPSEQVGGLSSDGSTVFFAATGKRLPAALNSTEVESKSADGEPVAANVYQWHDGVLSLISTGTSILSDELIGASANGADVFFATNSQLLGQDDDQAPDVYDARVGGGFPGPATPAPCTSLATCRSVFATPPVQVMPASVSVGVSGNVTTVTESPSPMTNLKPKSLTSAQKLSKALKSCKKLTKKDKRVACEASAHKRYGPRNKAKGKA
ncbi:MAG TPA: hypothetical protein VK680_09030 [Solirubrobacteraceae bacterium]|nr:hypothetical protein [Solirubrobacteraceae bacterium]